MNLTQLRYFVAIARNRSLSRAASELHVSQPALTRQIKLLERELDCALLQRHARGVALTDSGRILAERAERQLRDFEQLRSDISDASFAPTGRLRIGCPPSLGPHLLLHPLTVFMQNHPKVVVEVQENVSDQLLRAVLHDSLDVAIVSTTVPETSPHFVTEPLFREPVWLFGPRQRADGFARLKLEDVPLILTQSNNAARDVVEQDAKNSGRKLNVVAETDSPRLMLEMIKAGLGYTIAPYLTFLNQLRARELSGRPLKRLAVQRSLIRRKDRPANKAMQLFRSLLRSEIEKACREIAKARG